MRLTHNNRVLAATALLGLSATLSNLWAKTGDQVFSENFNTQAAFNRWDVVDLNGGRAWEYLNGTAAYMLDYLTFLPGDDWLISPAFELQPNTAYELRFYMNVLTKVESMRVALAPSNDPAVLSQHFLAEYDHVTSNDKGEQVIRICTDNQGGTYHLGYYAYSDPDQHRIEVDNILLTDIGPATIPDNISDLSGTAGDEGALTATLQFLTPDKCANGEALDALTAVHIYRGQNLSDPIHSIEQPAMGAQLSWTDDNATQGYNTYSIVAENASGKSQPATLEVYVGIDVPVAIDRVNARVEGDLSVTVSWQAPAASVHGGYVDYSALRYKVKRNNKTIYDALDATTFNDPTPGTNDKQGQVKYTITPIAGSMTGESTASVNIVTGKPLAMPYYESFADRQMISPWSQDAEAAEFDWKRSGDSSDEYGISSQDHDNGFLEAESTYGDRGQQSRYVTPIFDLSTLHQPLLTFWFYEGRDPWYDPEWQGHVNDRLQVQWRTLGNEWQSLEGATFYQNASGNGWVKCEVPLPHVDDQWVNLGMLAVADAENYAYRNIAIDNISITEAPYTHDVRLDTLTAASLRVSVGETMHLNVALTNRTDQAESISVSLLRNGEFFATSDTEIRALASHTVTFDYTATYADALADDIVWTAVVACPGDDVENNLSAPLVTSVRHAVDAPAVDGLQARMQAPLTVSLTWEPARSVGIEPQDDPVTVTESFDHYEPFIIDGIGAWTVVDRDQAPTLWTGRIPANYPHKGEPMAFQIFDVVEAGVWTEDNYDGAFAPRNDMRYLACPSAEYPYDNDDWLITPRLDGRAHTVSFYASAATYDAEWIRVYYSTTDAHPDSFQPLSDDDQIYVHEGWWKYEYLVPEGTRYFAVRCVRRSVFLCLDDFTYDAWQGHEQPRQLIGYNVYRDGQQLNAEPLTDASYSDTVPADSQYTYHVTALYDLGESPYSAGADIDTAASIPAIDAEMPDDADSFYDLYGRRLSEPHGTGIFISHGKRMFLH